MMNEQFDREERRRRLQVRVGGMSCSFCASTIERAIRRIEGIDRVRVSLAHEEALIIYDPDPRAQAEMQSTLRSLGYLVRDPDKAGAYDEQREELREERRRLVLVGSPRYLRGAGVDLSPGRSRVQALEGEGKTVVAAAVHGNRWRIEWLLGQGNRFRSILNPGRHVGYETIGLLLFLDAERISSS